MNAIERLVKQWYGFGGPYADCADDLNALLPELREMARDGERWNEWCKRNPLLTYRRLTGDGIDGAPYQPGKINQAMDAVIASGQHSLVPTKFPDIAAIAKAKP